MNLRDRTVLLTGATGGIGQAIARACADRGAKLILTGRQADVLEELAASLNARAIRVDLSDPTDVQRLIDEAGAVDVLIANAALPCTGLIEDLTEAQIGMMLEVNLHAPIRMAKAMIGPMRERGLGHLVFISSMSGKVASPYAGMYNATKFGLRGFAGALRQDLHGTGVGVSTICPGFISDAGMFHNSGVDVPKGATTRTPADVANATVKAIEKNIGELDVVTMSMRLAGLFGQLAPESASRVQRRMGGSKISQELADAQAGLRNG